MVMAVGPVITYTKDQYHPNISCGPKAKALVPRWLEKQPTALVKGLC